MLFFFDPELVFALIVLASIIQIDWIFLITLYYTNSAHGTATSHHLLDSSRCNKRA